MTKTYFEVKQAIDKNITSDPLMMKMSLWFFLFGVFMEWEGLGRLFKGYVKVNWLIVPAVVLTVLSFIPSYYWIPWFGVGYPFDMLWVPNTHTLLTAASGILFVRSLRK